jgi:aromatic-amino-acid transaminase
MSSSIFAAVEMAPRDPILGLNEAFNADARTTKVNLGVGVYFDDNGKIPLLAPSRPPKRPVSRLPCRAATSRSKAPAYNTAVQNLLLGKDSELWPTARSSPPRPSAAPAP